MAEDRVRRVQRRTQVVPRVKPVLRAGRVLHFREEERVATVANRKARFTPVSSKLDFVEQEHQILDVWERERSFAKLVEKNRGRERFSFIDGPITANIASMGVHHAWGRTYKDIFQRYKAMCGFDQRYQNGFDCQGLWVEVEVEKDL